MTHIDDDDDLRARFRSLAEQEGAAAPPLAHDQLSDARRVRSRGWVSPRRIALAAASVMIAVATLAIGLVLGTSTGYASGWSEGVRDRDAIAVSTEGVTRQLAALRGDLAQMRSGLIRLAEKGTVAHASLLAAEAAVDSMSANVARIEMSLTSRQDSSSRPTLALLRTALTCPPARAEPVAKVRQQGIPVVALPNAEARATQALGSLLNVHQASDGSVLVNDGLRRQLKLFDASLASVTTVFDSVAGTSTSYGRNAVALNAYLGDSLLFPDFSARSMLVLDGHGRIVRSLALSRPNELGKIGLDQSTTDEQGRIIYNGMWTIGNTSSGPAALNFSDSASLVRMDLDQRRIDTLAQIARPVAKVTGLSPDGKRLITQWGADPIATIDDWAQLSDGSIAIVRGHDYHVDWIRPNGAMESTPKMPFEWKRLTDDDKRRIFDSTRTAMIHEFADGSRRVTAMSSITPGFDPTAPPPPGSGGRGGRGGDGGGGAGGGDGRGCGLGCGVDLKSLIRQAEPVPVDKMSDFYPPIRVGTTMADQDGNLWILPTTSASSKQGELVYDVVNTNGVLYKRVRIPVGRLIVGFGQGGVVYMASGDKANGFYLERSRLPK